MTPFNYSDKLDGLTTAISVSDMDREDAPLVYVNAEFSRLTGFDPADCLGRNCRFLQGANTNQVAVDEISKGLKERATVEVCLLNYRKDGTPFHNLLMLAPFQGAKGANLFLGCQYELRPQVLRIEEHLAQVDGIVKLISSESNSPWKQTLTALQMRAQAVSALVQVYAAKEMSGR